MALSEGLKGFVNFFTKSFNDGSDDEAFMDLVDRDGDYDTDGTLALDTMYELTTNRNVLLKENQKLFHTLIHTNLEKLQ